MPPTPAASAYCSAAGRTGVVSRAGPEREESETGLSRESGPLASLSPGANTKDTWNGNKLSRKNEGGNKKWQIVTW